MIPVIKPETMGSIIEEVYTKNKDFGVEEFCSSLETDNRRTAIVLYSFIDAIADYMSEGDPEKLGEYSAIAKIACNLLYKSIEKQFEINEMDYE